METPEVTPNNSDYPLPMTYVERAEHGEQLIVVATPLEKRVEELEKKLSKMKKLVKGMKAFVKKEQNMKCENCGCKKRDCLCVQCCFCYTKLHEVYMSPARGPDNTYCEKCLIDLIEKKTERKEVIEDEYFQERGLFQLLKSTN